MSLRRIGSGLNRSVSSGGTSQISHAVANAAVRSIELGSSGWACALAGSNAGETVRGHTNVLNWLVSAGEAKM